MIVLKKIVNTSLHYKNKSFLEQVKLIIYFLCNRDQIQICNYLSTFQALSKYHDILFVIINLIST